MNTLDFENKLEDNSHKRKYDSEASNFSFFDRTVGSDGKGKANLNTSSEEEGNLSSSSAEATNIQKSPLSVHATTLANAIATKINNVRSHHAIGFVKELLSPFAQDSANIEARKTRDLALQPREAEVHNLSFISDMFGRLTRGQGSATFLELYIPPKCEHEYFGQKIGLYLIFNGLISNSPLNTMVKKPPNFRPQLEINPLNMRFQNSLIKMRYFIFVRHLCLHLRIPFWFGIFATGFQVEIFYFAYFLR